MLKRNSLCLLKTLFFFLSKKFFFHIQPGTWRICSCMKWKIFTMNITYFLYFNIFNWKKNASLKSLISEVLLSLRLDKVFIYKPIFCLKIGKWIPHTLPRYIQRFLLITDIRVGANNSFPDGCHSKVQQKHRSLKLLTTSIIIILSLLWEHYKHLKWILKGVSEWP